MSTKTSLFRLPRRPAPEAALLAFALVVLPASGLPADDPVQLPVGDAKVASLAFSPDGKRLAVGTSGPTAILFDVRAARAIRELPLEGRGAGFSVAFSSDGKRLAIADYGLKISVRDAAGSPEIAVLPGDPERKKYRQARRLAFLGDGQKLVAGYSTGEVFVWDLAGEQVALKFDHGNEITAVAVSPDGRWIATGTAFGFRLWDAATGKAVVSLDQKSSGVHEVYALAFSTDGKTVATADSPGYVRFFATDDGKELGKFQMPSVGGQTTVSGLGLTPEGKTAVVPGLIAGLDPKRPKVLEAGILLLDIKRARPRAFVAGGSAGVFALSPDGKTAAIASGDSGDAVFLYDLTQAVPVKPR
ncbi:MAG TPA: hypothetical protein VG826_06625 [Pirellulales bacterium]|nr:hypothetical protein [Pirellulales bacterium]